MSKKVKLKSVDRNVRKTTRAERKRPSKPVNKQAVSRKATVTSISDEQNRIRIEEAKKANVVILSTETKPREVKIVEPAKKTIKDPLWYIGSGVLWLFDTLRGRTAKPEEEKETTPKVIVVKEEPKPEPEPVVVVVKEEPKPEPEPVVVVVKEEPKPEPEPVVVVVKEEPKPEPEPVVVVVKEEPKPEPEPVVVVAKEETVKSESVVVSVSTTKKRKDVSKVVIEKDEDEDLDDEVFDLEDDEDDDERGVVIIGAAGSVEKKVRGISFAYLTKYARITARGADRRIRENIKLAKKKASLEKKLSSLTVPKKASIADINRIDEEKEALLAEITEISEKIEINLYVAESLERATDEYLYIRKMIDGTMIEDLRRTPRIHEVVINVDQEYLNSLIEKYNAMKMARESK